ncbi:hypothetical protein QXB70_002112 [Vibrio fluvialis]|nr:hypothetical protein [Vibrio fluvialis]
MSNIHDVPRGQTFDKYKVIDRKPYSEHLTDFLNSKAKYGYVLNLNAEWGSGKTTFLQCWYNELKEKHPVVYFDAWKSDFTHDAMLALLEAFHSQLMNALTENKALLKKIMEGGAHFIKNTSWKLALGFIKRQGGMDTDEPLFSDISEELNELGLDASDLTESLKETFAAMSEQKRKVEGVHDFKTTLVELSKAYLEVHHHKKGPIYVLIDELDRCRPTYAIEVIESVKHFFNTENFVFVLATDTEQLQHSIRAVYGQGFDSSNYLRRFFDKSITLPVPLIGEYLFSKLEKYLSHSHIQRNIIVNFINNLFFRYEIHSIREVDKILNLIEIAESKNKKFKLLSLLILGIIKIKSPEIFETISRTNIVSIETITKPKSLSEYFNTKNISVRITNVTSQNVSIDSISCLVLPTISNSPTHVTYNYYNGNHQLTSTEISQMQADFLSSFTINEYKEFASKNDYVSVIDFAGCIR